MSWGRQYSGKLENRRVPCRYCGRRTGITLRICRACWKIHVEPELARRNAEAERVFDEAWAERVRHTFRIVP